MAESKLPPNIPINTFGQGLGFNLVKGEFFMVKTRNVSFNQNVVKKGTKIAFLPYVHEFHSISRCDERRNTRTIIKNTFKVY